MAFTATLSDRMIGVIPDGNYAKESWDYVNTGGSTGGTITPKWLKNISFVVGANITVSTTFPATTATIVTNVNSSGTLELYGQN